MQTSLIGKAKELEVASILVKNGLYVFFPLVDAGVDLVVTNEKASAFIPVQVKYRASEPALALNQSDIARFVGTKVVLAYVIGTGKSQKTWFVPFQRWYDRSKDKKRRDGKVYVTISENEEWLRSYKDDAGVRNAFEELFCED